ncbi:LysM peptidoglycan-binding domain-containing protein [Flavobacteriaceae bacterium]|nr:LysM peptidoglycan-binding domain-containing protein [Flavobacteriaceae bacterium]MDB4256292.1 LysM peptidoglycan-binding domain-containing protein [Flavobacteriaceae bacterium]MDC0636546.1 LysM peptidoglycan-binding domain-containing protein [Flavobacteriaceae bacterium]
MREFKIIIILFFVVIATSCAQQKKYISYTVKKGETLKIIAKRIGIKTKELMRLNPDTGRKPAPETLIIIPNNGYKSPTVNNILDKLNDSITTEANIAVKDTLVNTFVLHKVVKGDTFYNLTRAYNVSEEELKILNPLLDVSGLQLEMLLKIKPIKEENNILIYKDTIQENSSLKLAMMLPFRAIEYDTIDAKDIFKNNRLVNITTDIYLGASIAVDSLIKLGIDIELSVFDTGRKDTKLDSILTATDFSNTDVIIGPLYSEEVPKVAVRSSTSVVFPVYSKKQTSFKSSKIIKTFADREVHQEGLINYIYNNYGNENILIIGDSSTTSIRNSNLIKSKLLLHDSINEAQIIYPNLGYIRKDYVINALKAEVGNWVILATDNRVISSDVINSLISLPVEEPEEEEEEEDEDEEESDEPEMQILPEDTVIKVFGIFKSSQFDRIDNNKLAKLGFTFTSDTFYEESSPEIQLFNQQYFNQNHVYPSYYATKGFDIVFDVGMRLASGNKLKQTFKNGTSYRLESKFDYTKDLFKTTSNKGIYILEYNSDMTISRLK